MVDAMRAALDELMGKERNLAPEERTGKGITYKDPQICKYALGGLCPYGLFKNTKSDLGLCKYEVHDDDVEFGPAKEEYDKLPEAEKDRYGYRNEMVELLRTLCRDMDRKIERQKERAAKESASRAPTATEQAELDKLKQQEKDALKKSEEAAEQGNVDESMAFANQAEQLQKQYTELHKLATTPDRTMQVCEVCGVFINSSDSDQRKADHLAGKQYTGWVKIRETLKACLAEDEEKRKNGVLPRNDHERERRGRDERGREDRDRDRERDRDRDRERDRRRRSRSRDYDRHRRDSYRDRDRDRSSRHYSGRDRRGGSGNYNRGTEIPPPSDLYSKRPTGERERYY